MQSSVHASHLNKAWGTFLSGKSVWSKEPSLVQVLADLPVQGILGACEGLARDAFFFDWFSLKALSCVKCNSPVDVTAI